MNHFFGMIIFLPLLAHLKLSGQLISEEICPCFKSLKKQTKKIKDSSPSLYIIIMGHIKKLMALYDIKC